MPFKSLKQIAKFHELEKAGKLAKGTTDKWLKETPLLKKLPLRIGPPKTPKMKSVDDLRAHFKKRFGG